MAVYEEVWTGELVKQFDHADQTGFLEGISDQSQYVNNDAIHLVEVGVNPDVLVNNTTYPIPIQEIDDEDIVIKLDKFQTKRTRVTDDELHACSYDKIKTRREGHGNSITKNKHDKAIHSIAPNKHTKKTPVIKTTGPDDGTGRRKMVRKDIINLKKEADDAAIPDDKRRLVLCNMHVNDLLDEDDKFYAKYLNHIEGKVNPLYGFKIFSYLKNPMYSQTGEKLSFGAIPGATDSMASVFFYTPRIFKATGSTKMYYIDAKNNPAYQASEINFRHRFIVLPKLLDAMGSIISGRI